MEMLQSSKGVGSQLLDEQRIENERLRGRLIEAEARTRHLESMLENLKRDQDRGDLGKNRQVSFTSLNFSYSSSESFVALHQVSGVVTGKGKGRNVDTTTLAPTIFVSVAHHQASERASG